MISFLRYFKHKFLDVRHYCTAILIKRSIARKNLFVLYLFADTDKYPNSFLCLQRILSRIMGVRITIVKINNFASDVYEQRLSDDVYEISGDNEYWEFSGWKKGVEYLKQKGIEDANVLFVNDAFLNKSDVSVDYYFFKELLNTVTLNNIKGYIGQVWDKRANKEGKKYSLRNCDASRWLQTHFFVLPFEIAASLRFTYLTDEEINAILPMNYVGKLFLDTDVLSEDLKNFLMDWITINWHDAQVPSKDNWRFLRSKLVAILNERLLSVELEARGVFCDDLMRCDTWQANAVAGQAGGTDANETA